MERLAFKLEDGVVVGDVAGDWAVAELPKFGTPVPDPAIDQFTAHCYVSSNAKCVS